MKYHIWRCNSLLIPQSACRSCVQELGYGQCLFSNLLPIISIFNAYGGVFEIAQKAIEGCHCHMMAYAFDFELAQNSNHSVFLIFLLEISITCQNSELAHFFLFENPELAQNSNHFCLELNFSSNFVLTQVFQTRKSVLTQSFDT